MKKGGFALWQMLVKKEILLVYRNKTILISAVMIWALFVAAMICAFLDYQSAHQQRSAANTLFRQQWEHQQRNPHDAAHFGTYLFKSINLLNVFDTGLDDYTGSTYRIEAHVQHELNSNNAESNDASIRFGRLSLALILQLLVPLLILFSTATSITSEKENGTLKMLLAQGLDTTKLLWTKVIANYLLIVFIVLPVFMLMAVSILFSPAPTILLPRLLWICIGYLLYFLLIALLGTIISALSSNSGKALLAALCFWILTGIILPKVVTGMADRSYPLISRASFSDLVEQGYRNGLNGHDPYAKRGERYIKSLLKKYHVDTVTALPFNIEGLTFQFNEDYRTLVFNHYLKQVEHRFAQQQHLLSTAGIFDPFMSIKRFSMALSGSDLYHHQHFFKQAQAYRNHLIGQLNRQLALYGKDVKGEYKVGPQYFKKLKDFNYQLPAPGTILALKKTALFSLLGWIALLSLILQFVASRVLALNYESA